MARSEERQNIEGTRHGLKVISSGKPVEFMIERTGAAGNSIFIESIKFPVRDAAGEIIGIGGVSTDITARRQARESLALNRRCFRRHWTIWLMASPPMISAFT